MAPLNISYYDELLSAISSLNTYADVDDRLDTEEYISETVHAARHAIEHINAAIKLLLSDDT